MTAVYVTIDTELSARLFAREGLDGIERNFACSITGETGNGGVGIFHQMDRLDAYGLKAVFFVDPMPALVAGIDILKRIVQPIVARGHDVQLHIHTEWLAFARDSPVGGRTGRNIRDFTLDDQCALVALARALLMEAGAPPPVAFRAGNYGADDNTLRALAMNAIVYDSSFSPGIAFSDCRIGLRADVYEPVEHCGVIEVPIAAISGWGGARRHVQLTALSAWEMAAAINHAAASGQRSFSLVSHSFELMRRDRSGANPLLVRRFESLCRMIADQDGIDTATYRDNPPSGGGDAIVPMPHNPVRTAMRLGEQIVSNSLYGEAGSHQHRTWSLRRKLVEPLQDLVPLQNIAVDMISAL